MDFKVTTTLDTLRHTSIDTEAVLVALLHRLLADGHGEPDASIVSGLLLVHVGVECGLVKVDDRPAFYNPFGHPHRKFNSLTLQPYRVFVIWVQLSICRSLFYTIADIEVSERIFRDVDSVQLLDFD